MTEQARDPRRCDAALRSAFEILGKRWNGMIISVLMESPAGFGTLRRAIDGISDSVLSDRLAELTRVGLVHRRVVEGPPVGVSYELTDTARELQPALDRLSDWAVRNLHAPQPA